MKLRKKGSKACKVSTLLHILITSSYFQHTFIAPFVAMALNDKAVKNEHAPQNETKTSDCHMPAIPTILQKGKRNSQC